MLSVISSTSVIFFASCNLHPVEDDIKIYDSKLEVKVGVVITPTYTSKP